MDIHHINTGRGNSSFIIFPDSTWSAGKSIVNYIQQLSTPAINIINYALITHYHSDHYGSVRTGTSKSSKGNYFLTGITEVADHWTISQKH